MGMNWQYNLEAREAWLALSEQQRNMIRTKDIKHPLGYEQKEGFTAPLPFFLFFCEHCEHESKDYPHGFNQSQYLSCSNCGARHDFVPWWIPFAELWVLIKLIFRAPSERAF